MADKKPLDYGQRYGHNYIEGSGTEDPYELLDNRSPGLGFWIFIGIVVFFFLLIFISGV